MPKKQPLVENARILESSTTTAGHKLVQLISPGWGSSGYYSASVLEQAASDVVIPAGTHMYADHPTDVEAMERPGRSIKDLISVTASDARLATTADIAAGADQGALVAEVRIAAPYRDLIEDLGDSIGVSIRGDATDITVGEAEGRSGRIIEGLAHVESVDWVTRAGRGGRVLQLLESAWATANPVRRGINEATANDTRDALSTVVRATYGSDEVWVWVRDFDDSTVWFDLDGDENGTYAQTYTRDEDGSVALTGDRTEVRVVTTYVPATRSDGNTTEESEEDTMPQIEESELAQLREAHGRVPTLESERDTAIRERDEARRQLAATQRVTRATVLVNERADDAGVAFDPLQLRGLLVDLPLTESGDLDEAAFTTRVDEAAAEIAARGGAGRVQGFGGTPGGGGAQLTESDVDIAVGAAFGRQVKGA